VQPGQRLMLGTRQSGLKPPRASAMPVADRVDASNVKHTTIREFQDMAMLAFKGDASRAIAIAAGSGELLFRNESADTAGPAIIAVAPHQIAATLRSEFECQRGRS